jgi:small GTP-binding protein
MAEPANYPPFVFFSNFSFYGLFRIMRLSAESGEIPSFKVCICGEESVGKTALLNRYVTGSFNADYRPTIAATFVSAQEIVDHQVVMLNIWDTAGQEKYQSMMPLYLRNAECVILVLDVTKPSSWNYVTQWYETDFPNLFPRPSVYVCANKSDLDPVIDMNAIAEWAMKQDIPLFNTSALTGLNTAKIFKKVAQDLESQHRTKKIAQSQSKMKASSSKSDGCC